MATQTHTHSLTSESLAHATALECVAFRQLALKWTFSLKFIGFNHIKPIDMNVWNGVAEAVVELINRFVNGLTSRHNPKTKITQIHSHFQKREEETKKKHKTHNFFWCFSRIKCYLSNNNTKSKILKGSNRKRQIKKTCSNL